MGNTRNETQNYLITRIIQVADERHGTLAEAVRARFLNYDEVLRFAGIGLEAEEISEFEDSTVRWVRS